MTDIKPGETYRILYHPLQSMVGVTGIVVECLPFGDIVVLAVGNTNHEIPSVHLKKVDTFFDLCDRLAAAIAGKPQHEQRRLLSRLLLALTVGGVNDDLVEVLECALAET